MMAIQLDLFTGQAIADPVNPETETEMQVRPGNNINPCIGCELREWCSDDDCAKKGYPIDLPTTHFRNLNDMITYFRTHDILGL